MFTEAFGLIPREERQQDHDRLKSVARKEVVGFVWAQKQSMSLHVFVEHLGRWSMKLYILNIHPVSIKPQSE